MNEMNSSVAQIGWTVLMLFSVAKIIQDYQKVSVHLSITVHKTHKNILNSINHLPW
jgi:hypothetical protein